LDDSADVRVCANGRFYYSSAISATTVNGDGYFVHAYISDLSGLPSGGVETRLDVYGAGQSPKRFGLAMPVDTYTYRSFAYTTKSDSPQNDLILAYNQSTGDLLGTITRTSGGSTQIGSVNSAGTPLEVKLESYTGGVASVSDIKKTSATFHNSGQKLQPKGSVTIDYATDPSFLSSTTVYDGMSSSPITMPSGDLVANTRYYLRSMSHPMGHVAGSISYPSPVVAFNTLPDVLSATAEATGATGAMVSSDFLENAANNADVTGAWLYYSTKEIDYSDLEAVRDEDGPLSPASLPKGTGAGEYSNAGFSDFEITGLEPGTEYNILVVAGNGDEGAIGGKDAKLASFTTESLSTTLTISSAVAGSQGEKTRQFTYTATFKDAGGSALAGPLAYTGGGGKGDGSLSLSGGSATFTLKHGESVTIADVPASGRIAVTQAGAPYYTPSYTDAAGSPSTESASAPGESLTLGERPMSAGRAIAFSNARSPVVASAVDGGGANLAAIVILAALLGALITARLRLRRRAERVFR
jgi:hypothetical protein